MIVDSASSPAIATVSIVPSALRVGWPTGMPVATSTRRFAAAPVAVAVQTKIGPQEEAAAAPHGDRRRGEQAPV